MHFAWIAVFLMIAISVFQDLRMGKLKNWVSLAGFVLGFVINLFYIIQNRHPLFIEIVIYIGEVLIAFIISFFFYSLDVFGAGDAKLLISLCAILRLKSFLIIFILSTIIGGFFALLQMIRNKRIKQGLKNILFIFLNMQVDKKSMVRFPFTIPIGISVLINFFIEKNIIPIYKILGV